MEHDGLQGLDGLIPRQAWHATLVNGSPRQYATAVAAITESYLGQLAGIGAYLVVRTTADV